MSAQIVERYCVPGIWESSLRECADNYYSLCEQLQQSVLHEDKALRAWYQLGETPYTGYSAREEIATWLTQTLKDINEPRFGYIECSPKTLLIAEQYNVAGKIYAGTYSALRKEIKGHTQKEDAATTIARQVLASIGEHDTDLERVRRQAGIALGVLQRIRWFITNESKSIRCQLSDAVAALETLRDNVSEDRALLITHEIDTLKSPPYNPCQPVAVKRKTTVPTVRCRAWLWNQSIFEVITETFSGTLPLLCSSTQPVIETALPKPIRKKGAGRPSIISNRSVSPSLPGWFYYEHSTAQPSDSTNKMLGLVIQKRQSAPTLQTQITNAKIFLKKESGVFRAYLSYHHSKKRVLIALNIKRYEECWIRLADKAIAVDATIDKKEWLEQYPPKEAVIEWLESNGQA